jgi:hypothetical protein
MGRFTSALNFMEVKEIELIGRCFTWSNNQSVPTLSQIDRAFCTPLWENGHSQPIVQALSSSASDHYPILLMPLSTPPSKPKFRFETYWVNMPGFYNCVQDAWSEYVSPNYNPLKVLHVKLSRTSKALRAWSKHLILQEKIAMAVCREVVGQLEVAQKIRSLTAKENPCLKL